MGRGGGWSSSNAEPVGVSAEEEKTEIRAITDTKKKDKRCNNEWRNMGNTRESKGELSMGIKKTGV